MEFTFDFIRMFAVGLFYAAPLLATLVLIIVILGHLLGKAGRVVKTGCPVSCLHYRNHGRLWRLSSQQKTLKISRHRDCLCRHCFYRHRGCTCDPFSHPRLQGNARQHQHYRTGGRLTVLRPARVGKINQEFSGQKRLAYHDGSLNNGCSCPVGGGSGRASGSASSGISPPQSVRSCMRS